MTMFASTVDCEVFVHLNRPMFVVPNPDEEPNRVELVLALGGVVEAASADYLRVSVEALFTDPLGTKKKPLTPSEPIDLIIRTADIGLVQPLTEPDGDDDDDDDDGEEAEAA